MAINYFDIFVIIVLAFFFIKGAYSGFFEEVSGLAAIVLSIVPCIIAYVCFQEQIVSGLTSGAVKG